MKRIAVGLMGAVLSAGVFAAPTVLENSVTVVQPVSGKVDVLYVLPGPDPAVITIDIQRNEGGEWVSIGDENVRTLSGEVNKAVAPSANPRTIRWDAATDWPRQKITGGKIRAVVEAWPTNAPPPWMVIALANAEVRFYRSETALPYALTDMKMKTDYLVMRKVPAANVAWRMGKPDADGTDRSVQPAKTLTLTEDYYLAVYPLTQKQFANIKEKTGLSLSPTLTENDGLGDARPIYNLRYIDYRGARPDYDWPNTLPLHALAPNSLLGKLRGYVGQGLEFDLPTEAQWEYACRAGRTGTWNADGSVSSFCYTASSGGVRDVGYARNDWGLYDMHGNVSEFCLDYWGDYDPCERVDPKGDKEDKEVSDSADPKRVRRGGFWNAGKDIEKFGSCYGRYRCTDNHLNAVSSLRLCCPPVVALPKRPARGRLVICYDGDAENLQSWVDAMPVFRRYDAHMTFFVMGELSVEKIAQMKALETEGHTVGSLGYQHVPMDVLLTHQGVRAVEEEFTQQKTVADAVDLRFDCFAYPQSRRNELTDEILLGLVSRLRGGQLATRGSAESLAKTPLSQDPLKNHDESFVNAAETHGAKVIIANCIPSLSEECVADICGALERTAASDETLPLYTHKIEATGFVASDSHNLTIPQLESILAKAQELGVAIVGFDEL